MTRVDSILAFMSLTTDYTISICEWDRFRSYMHFVQSKS